MVAFNPRLYCWLILPFLLAAWGLEAGTLWAGASPCQWVVAVNGQSARSRTIANHYVHWRNIPMANVIVLPEVPAANKISLKDFREKILYPLLEEIGRRKLTTHIQGIAYSADFPLAIDVAGESKHEGKIAQYMTPVASITGLTYLYRFVRDFGNFVELNNNWYAGREPSVLFTAPNGDNEAEIEKQKKQLMELKEHSKLGLLLEQQMLEYPDQFPLAYLAAQAWAEAGQTTRAVSQLQKAIELGWSFSQYIVDDPRLKSLHEFNRFQLLVKSCDDDPFTWLPFVGFDARRNYAPNGVSTYRAYKNSGVTYLPSFVLAVCGPLGNTEEEALRQLKRSIDADFSKPKGGFYYTLTGDVRTTCRQPGFELARDRLLDMGFEAEIIKEGIPTGKECLGVTMGEATFSWTTSRSKLMPGAIGDNLTSLGAVMDTPNQTKLTEFLRHGAAAASGTVTEPYSIQAKFPHPMIHAAYASGLTAAEAYYASVSGPYQLLIAGDPLCQPFATAPAFSIAGLEQATNLIDKLTVEIVPAGVEGADRPRFVGLLLDGELKGAQPMPPGADIRQRITMAAEKFSNGAHELRFVATDSTRKETKFERSYWLTSGPDYNQIKLSGPERWKAAAGQPLTVEVFGTDSDAVIEIRHDREYVLTVEEGRNSIEVPTENLGRGPVRLQAVATIGATEVASLPITVFIE